MTTEHSELAQLEKVSIKKCLKCGIEKETSGFHKSPKTDDGLKSRCKECVKKWGYEYRSSRCTEIRERSKIHRIKLISNPEKMLLRRKQSKASSKRSQLRYPDRERSRRAVENAKISGKLVVPDKCSECMCVCTPEAHHDSYDYDQRLNVRWLCRKCHAAHHRKYPDPI